jgi:hypothetical protein
VVVVCAGGTSADAQLPAGDSVTGTVTLVLGGPSFRFDAHSGPSGESATGTITHLTPAGVVDGIASVACLSVNGNRATVVAGVGDPHLLQVIAFIEDNGAGVDRFFGTSGIALGCALDLPVGASLAPVFSGDLIVVDASPLPTSKSQCKKGGWRSFPGFKNQGDCVSFVAHE